FLHIAGDVGELDAEAADAVGELVDEALARGWRGGDALHGRLRAHRLYAVRKPPQCRPRRRSSRISLAESAAGPAWTAVGADGTFASAAGVAASGTRFLNKPNAMISAGSKRELQPPSLHRGVKSGLTIGAYCIGRALLSYRSQRQIFDSG